ncbi:MAG: NfeD family protein [Phycisphaerales bacterium JB063]
MALSLVTLGLTLAQQSQSAPPDRSLLVWAVVAFGLAVLLVVVEAFMPSGGIVGALAGVCAVVGIVLFFNIDTLWGMISMAITLIALPFLIAGLIWVWPNTAFGRWVTLGDDDAGELEGNGPNADSDGAVTVGTLGMTLTDLRPVGACRLEGRRTDCIALSGVIPSGTPVKVVSVEGSTVKVKPDPGT